MSPGDFLRALQTRPPYGLGAIAPDGGPKKWLTVTSDKGVDRFVRRYNDDHNVYYQVNRVRADLGTRRATKADITECIAVHCEIDPPDGVTNLAAWQRHEREKIDGLWRSPRIPKPTLAAFTGSGFKLVWLLDEATQDRDAVESVNRELVRILGGDKAATDVSRLLRLPSTLNHPGEKKRRKYGRTEPVLAEVIYFDASRRYPLDVFPTSKVDATSSGYDAIERGEPVSREELKKRVRDKNLRRRVTDGAQAHEDRSDAVWAVARDLRKWLPDERVVAVLLDPQYKISAHCLDASDPMRAACRAVSRGKEERNDPRLVLTCMADVQPMEVRWLWTGRVPLDEVTIFDGEPGIGKGTVIADLAARITTGRAMPNEKQRRAPASVVILTLEENLATTCRPRLDAAGADVRRVHVLEALVNDDDGSREMPCLPSNFDELRSAIEQTGALLVVIDPLLAYLDEDINENSNKEIRREVMDRLVALAREKKIAIIGIRHYRKGAGTAGVRGQGATSFTAAARSVLAFGKNPDEADERLIACTKVNVGNMPATLRYRVVEGDNGAGRIDWLGESARTADEVAGQAVQTQTADCERWLSAYLADGARDSREIKQAAEARAYGDRVLRDARERLGVRDYRKGKPPNQVSLWELPAKRVGGAS